MIASLLPSSDLKCEISGSAYCQCIIRMLELIKGGR